MSEFFDAGQWLGNQMGNYLSSNASSIKQSAQALLLNNAKHFGSFGSDLPVEALAPIVQSEAEGKNPYDFVSKVFNASSGEPSDPNIPLKRQLPNSGSSITPTVKAELDYLNAELAKHYGMSASTAYQEALSNTSYQRAVKDMKAAGLNPAVLFGSGRAQGSNASIYASEASSGSGYRGRSSSSDDKLFSGSAYSAIQAIGGLIGIASTKRPDGFWIGSQTAQGVMGLLDSIGKK